MKKVWIVYMSLVILYMSLVILYMLKIKRLKMILKEKMVFFVLQLLEVVLMVHRMCKLMKYCGLLNNRTSYQFSVLDSVFSVIGSRNGKTQFSVLSLECSKKLEYNGNAKF